MRTDCKIFARPLLPRPPPLPLSPLRKINHINHINPHIDSTSIVKEPVNVDICNHARPLVLNYGILVIKKHRNKVNLFHNSLSYKDGYSQSLGQAPLRIYNYSLE